MSIFLWILLKVGVNFFRVLNLLTKILIVQLNNEYSGIGIVVDRLHEDLIFFFFLDLLRDNNNDF